jgi:hypothetical protein
MAVFSTEAGTLSSLKPLSLMKKDQYETTAAFNQRVCSATLTALKANSDRTATFLLFPSVSSGVRYDADRGKLIYSVQLGFPSLFFYSQSFDRYIGIKLATDERPKPSYYGSNAFGNSKEVFVSETEEAMLLLPRTGPDSHAMSMEFSIPMKPEIAKQLKDDIQFVVKTTIAAPCFASGRDRTRPTITSPFERDATLFAVVGSNRAVWKVLKKSTGEVLKSGTF